eukprot:Clim_evm6s206 gene=Clim_evmTU6s206
MGVGRGDEAVDGDLLEDFFTVVQEYRYNDSGDELSHWFMKLQVDPAAFEEGSGVSNPLALGDVRQNMEDAKYTTVKALADDMHKALLGFKNYHGKNSEKGRAAQRLIRITESMRRIIDPHTDAFADLLGLEDQQKCEYTLRKVAYAKDENEGRYISDAFWSLPDKKELPDYYATLKHPIDFYTIQTRVASDYYFDPEQDGGGVTVFLQDMYRLLDNARVYNAEGSPIYTDAGRMETIMHKAMGPLGLKKRGKIPDIADLITEAAQKKMGLNGSNNKKRKLNPQQQAMMDVVSSVSNYKNAKGKKLADPLQRLPSRAELPDYYKVIPDPMDLETLKRNVQEGVYETAAEFDKDMMKIFLNARIYNNEGSVIFENAQILEKVYQQKRKELLNAEDDEDDEDDEDEEEEEEEEEEEAPPKKKKKKLSTKKDGDKKKKKKKKVKNVKKAASEKAKKKKKKKKKVKNVKKAASEKAKKKKKKGKKGSGVSSNGGSKKNLIPDEMVAHVVKQKPKPLVKQDQSSSSVDVTGWTPQKLRDEYLTVMRKMRNIEDNGRKACEKFFKLPSRKEQPAYYQTIDQPIDFVIIEERIKAHKYPHPDEFYEDMKLLINNVKHVYTSGTQSHRDATRLQKAFWKAFTRHFVLQKPFKQAAKEAQGAHLPTARGVIRAAPGTRKKEGKKKKKGDKLKQPKGVAPKSKASSSGAAGALDPEKMRTLVEKTFKALQAHKDYSQFGPLLMSAPPRTQQQYYLVVKRPMDLKLIQTHLKAGGYQVIEQLDADIVQIYANTTIYYPEDSKHYEAAELIKKTYEKVRKQTFGNKVKPMDESCEIDDRGQVVYRRDLGSGITDPLPIPESPLENILFAIWTEFLNLQADAGYAMHEPFDVLPKPKDLPDYYVMIKNPIDLQQIRMRLVNRYYRSLSMFQHDLFRMFRNCRVFNDSASDLYADCITLQKHYITLRDEICQKMLGSRLDSSALRYDHSELENELADFEVLARAEEGANQKPPAEDNPTVSFMKSITVDNKEFAVGNYVYWKAVEAEEPHVGQIIKLWRDKSGVKRAGSTAYCLVTWFMRPEDTVHPPNRQFYRNEVFKASLDRIIPCTALIRKCYIMWFDEYRQRIPRDIPPKDVYVAESRYNEQSRAFQKIKKWNKIGDNATIKIARHNAHWQPDKVPSPLSMPKKTVSHPMGLLKDVPLDRDSARMLQMQKQGQMKQMGMGGDGATEDEEEEEMILEEDVDPIQLASGNYKKPICYELLHDSRGRARVLGEFVVVRLEESGVPGIGRVERLTLVGSKRSTATLHVRMFKFPGMLKGKAQKVVTTMHQFCLGEVIQTDEVLTMAATAVIRGCHVLHINHYVGHNIIAYGEHDVYFCQTAFTTQQGLASIPSIFPKVQLKSATRLEFIERSSRAEMTPLDSLGGTGKKTLASKAGRAKKEAQDDVMGDEDASDAKPSRFSGAGASSASKAALEQAAAAAAIQATAGAAAAAKSAADPAAAAAAAALGFDPASAAAAAAAATAATAATGAAGGATGVGGTGAAVRGSAGATGGMGQQTGVAASQQRGSYGSGVGSYGQSATKTPSAAASAAAAAGMQQRGSGRAGTAGYGAASTVPSSMATGTYGASAGGVPGMAPVSSTAAGAVGRAGTTGRTGASGVGGSTGLDFLSTFNTSAATTGAGSAGSTGHRTSAGAQQSAMGAGGYGQSGAATAAYGRAAAAAGQQSTYGRYNDPLSGFSSTAGAGLGAPTSQYGTSATAAKSQATAGASQAQAGGRGGPTAGIPASVYAAYQQQQQSSAAGRYGSAVASAAQLGATGQKQPGSVGAGAGGPSDAGSMPVTYGFSAFLKQYRQAPDQASLPFSMISKNAQREWQSLTPNQRKQWEARGQALAAAAGGAASGYSAASATSAAAAARGPNPYAASATATQRQLQLEQQQKAAASMGGMFDYYAKTGAAGAGAGAAGQSVTGATTASTTGPQRTGSAVSDGLDRLLNDPFGQQSTTAGNPSPAVSASKSAGVSGGYGRAATAADMFGAPTGGRTGAAGSAQTSAATGAGSAQPQAVRGGYGSAGSAASAKAGAGVAGQTATAGRGAAATTASGMQGFGGFGDLGVKSSASSMGKAGAGASMYSAYGAATTGAATSDLFGSTAGRGTAGTTAASAGYGGYASQYGATATGAGGYGSMFSGTDFSGTTGKATAGSAGSRGPTAGSQSAAGVAGQQKATGAAGATAAGAQHSYYGATTAGTGRASDVKGLFDSSSDPYAAALGTAGGAYGRTGTTAATGTGQKTATSAHDSLYGQYGAAMGGFATSGAGSQFSTAAGRAGQASAMQQRAGAGATGRTGTDPLAGLGGYGTASNGAGATGGMADYYSSLGGYGNFGSTAGAAGQMGRAGQAGQMGQYGSQQARSKQQQQQGGYGSNPQQRR